MRALAVLYGGSLTKYAFENVFGGKCALSLALEQVRSFPGLEKILLLTGPCFDSLAGSARWTKPAQVEIISRPSWTRKSLLETMSDQSQSYDFTWFAWADAPFLDAGLAGAVAKRHRTYAAEYSYADGWPYGFAPEILSPGVAGILSKILGNDDGEVERDILFSVIQKDINAFDIETEISTVDLRSYRLSFTADSRRNLLLLSRFFEAGFRGAGEAGQFIAEKPELLRTLPSFYAIQSSSRCPQSCAFCPYPKFGAAQGGEFLAPQKFSALLDKIAGFSGDAVIDLSLWGEPSLHPQKMELINLVLDNPDFSLIIETAGLGWKGEELEALAGKAASVMGKRLSPPWLAPKSPLSWIVSLDAANAERYGELRGPGFEEAAETAKTLFALFPKSAYVQALRFQGAEDDIEAFYRNWKELAPAPANIIIQKYDHFCGSLPKKQAADLSPVERQPCWHLARDMNILIDGRVPRCREDLGVLGDTRAPVLGNAFDEGLEAIWRRGEAPYREQASRQYSGLCAGCDEYYTFNF